ncbi:hypothetical protein A5689_08320 [Mycobacterium intracellulare subsp. yongonense]|nr:hypothetical protein A5689_08320 [Mycobacterium intracellulare subsp. yongonense]
MITGHPAFQTNQSQDAIIRFPLIKCYKLCQTHTRRSRAWQKVMFLNIFSQTTIPWLAGLLKNLQTNLPFEILLET